MKIQIRRHKEFGYAVADERDFRAGNNFTNELFSNEPRGDQICGCSARIFSRVFLFFSYYAIKQTYIPTLGLTL